MEDRVRIEQRDGIADVRLVRAHKMNAIDIPMFEALAATGESLMDRKDIRAVVLSGDGDGFCAGIDLSALETLNAKGPSLAIRERTHGDANVFQRAVLVWRDLPMPVIAAVHGVAFGGGFQLMLGADIRILAPATKLSVMEVRWGLVPDMGGTVLMRGLAREDVVKELTFTGRIFSGEEAATLGFATRLSETPYEDAVRLAATIAGHSPDATRAAKGLINAAGDTDRATQLAAEADAQCRMLDSANHREAVAAGMAKRAPVFGDPA